MKHILLLLSFFITIAIYAQPGTADKSYGTDNTGIVTVQKQLSVISSVMQPDDKLVLGCTGFSLTPAQYILTRHNKDGTVDTSFGNKGETIITVEDLITNVIYAEGLKDVAIQPDGKIVAISNVTATSFDDNVLVVRVLPDGRPDESFGSHGRIITDFGYATVATAIAVQADGKILVSGYQNRDLFNVRGDILIRYNPDGTLDKTFGKYGGYTSYDEIEGDRSYALVVQPDGKIVTGGSSDEKFLLVRFLANGSIDKSFGTEGAVKTAFSSGGRNAYINSLALDEKNRIVATGNFGGVGVARYLPDGTPDNSFGQGGKVELAFNGFSYSSVSGKKVFAAPDGKLVIYSVILGANDLFFRTALSGLNEDGSPDASFGTSEGQMIFNSAYADDYTSAARQSDSRIIVSGNKADRNYNYIGYALTRFNGYPQKAPLAMRIHRWLHNHGISWKGLPAGDEIVLYTVEQSTDGKVFLPLTKVSGLTNLKEYSITNASLLDGINYYRIKAVSTDGAIRYSEVVSADNSANTASVFPNPAKSYVTVQGLKSNETANISIRDGVGTVRANGVSSGSTQYHSSVASLPPGTYYMNITTNGKTETLKFMKE